MTPGIDERPLLWKRPSSC